MVSLEHVMTLKSNIKYIENNMQCIETNYNNSIQSLKMNFENEIQCCNNQIKNLQNQIAELLSLFKHQQCEETKSFLIDNCDKTKNIVLQPTILETKDEIKIVEKMKEQKPIQSKDVSNIKKACCKRKPMIERFEKVKKSSKEIFSKGQFLLIAYFDDEKNQRKVGLVKFCQYLQNGLLQGQWYCMKRRGKKLTVWPNVPRHEFDETNIIAFQNVVVNGIISNDAWQKLLQCEYATKDHKAWCDTNMAEILKATADLGNQNLRFLNR